MQAFNFLGHGQGREHMPPRAAGGQDDARRYIGHYAPLFTAVREKLSRRPMAAKVQTRLLPP